MTAWAFSLQPEIQSDCMEQLRTHNGDLRKFVECLNKKVVNKSIDDNTDIFGKNLNVSLAELALTVINQVALKMMMHSLVDLTFDMRCIPFLSQRCLVLLPVKPHQSI